MRHLLDQLLVLVELLQVLNAHKLESMVLGAIDVVLVAEDAVCAVVRQWRKKVKIKKKVERYQMVMPGRGTTGSLTVPEKRLSRMGS